MLVFYGLTTSILEPMLSDALMMGLLKLKQFFSTRIMNTQLVESIIQRVNALSPEERSLKERLLQSDRAQAVNLNSFSDSIQ